MIDLQGAENLQTFYFQTGANAWQVWNKPRGARFVVILAIGGGGGGGGANGNAIFGTQGGGGGSGGSGGVTHMIFPANMLPDRLFVQPGANGGGGAGGTGGASGLGGGAGGNTHVAVYPNSGASLLGGTTQAASGGGSGGGGTSAAGGAGGGAGAAATTTILAFSGVLAFNAGGGQGGSVGGFGVAGAARTTSIGLPVSAGGPGAGMPSASSVQSGGAVTLGSGDNLLPANYELAPGGAGNNTTGTAQPGGNGQAQWAPLLRFTGGGGGGAAHFNGVALGGRGGDGAFGSGGGGGGGATGLAGSTGGAGGNGGPGLVLIWTY